MKLTRVIAAGLIVGLALPSAAAHAQVRRGGGGGNSGQGEAPPPAAAPARPVPPRDAEAQRPQVRPISLNAAVDSIRRSTPGRLLDASGPTGGDRPIYRIRWQADSGQRIDFVVDALSGAIVGRN